METESKQEIKKEFLEEAKFLSRGAEILPGGVNELAKKLQKAKETNTPLRVKLGLDPTRPDLHLGHTVVMKKLRQFQLAGHKVVLIIGGATAMIGDPSGKSETRPSLTQEEVDENAKTYLNQMGKVVDISNAEVVNNSQWLSSMKLPELLKLASNVTVAQILARDDFSKRYAEGRPISIHELFYPLMQAYDSVAVESDIELGGTDQRFNVLLGREIQLAYGSKRQQLVMLLPLLEGTDGVVKMSKSYPEHCISLTDNPNDMYGKIMSIPDSLILRYFELLTDVPDVKINEYKKAMEENSVNPRDIKAELALKITSEYNSPELAVKASEEFVNIFKNKGIPENIPEIQAEEGKILIDFMVENAVSKSKGEARRLVEGGGVKIDTVKITDQMYKISFSANDNLILQAGKRTFVKIIKK